MIVSGDIEINIVDEFEKILRQGTKSGRYGDCRIDFRDNKYFIISFPGIVGTFKGTSLSEAIKKLLEFNEQQTSKN
jgi:hypothetical protein